ncbi:MAG: hypothetical protein WCS86_02160 [Candidatus Paceibacterota bacterium]
MKVDFLNIENQSCLSLEQIDEMKKILSESISENSFELLEDKPNTASMGNFKTVKITGILPFSEYISRNAKQFEIQIISAENKNEKGKMHHSIFDIVKRVVARTRLDGGCPESIFSEFVKDANRESGIGEKKIISYLTKEENAPIVEVKKGGKTFYVSYAVYSRWNKFGWVDNDLLSEIKRSKIKK